MENKKIKSQSMKLNPFSLFGFLKHKRWVCAVLAIVFTLTVCAPLEARQGNWGKNGDIWWMPGAEGKDVLYFFNLGGLAGAITGWACWTNPAATTVGCIVANAVGLYLYYYHYSEYGEPMFTIGNTDISKGSFYSMVAGVVASIAVGLIQGLISGLKNALKEAILKAILEALKKLPQDATKEQVQAAIKSAVENAIKEFLASAGKEVSKDIITQATEQAITEAGQSSLANGITAAIREGAVQGMNAAISGGAKAAASASGNFLSTLKDIYAWLAPAGSSGIRSAVATVLTTVLGVPLALGWSILKSVLDFIENIIKNISGLFTSEKGFWKTLWDKLVSGFENMFTRKPDIQNPYYMMGATREINLNLAVYALSDLGTAGLKLYIKEYIKQNVLEDEDEVIGDIVGGAVASMVGNLVRPALICGLGAITEAAGGKVTYPGIGYKYGNLSFYKVSENQQKGAPNVTLEKKSFGELMGMGDAEGWWGLSGGIEPLVDGVVQGLVLHALKYKTDPSDDETTPHEYSNIWKLGLAQAAGGIASGSLTGSALGGPAYGSNFNAVVQDNLLRAGESAAWSYISRSAGIDPNDFGASTVRFLGNTLLLGVAGQDGAAQRYTNSVANDVVGSAMFSNENTINSHIKAMALGSSPIEATAYRIEGQFAGSVNDRISTERYTYNEEELNKFVANAKASYPVVEKEYPEHGIALYSTPETKSILEHEENVKSTTEQPTAARESWEYYE